MAVAAFDKNGDGHDTPKLDPDVKKILVIGESKCGKSSFIKTFARDNFTAEDYPDTGARVYQYSWHHGNMSRKFAFVEIPSVDADNVNVAVFNHLDAKGCVFMFAIDDPSSFQQLREKWISQLNFFIKDNLIPAIAVGFKADLRHNPNIVTVPEEEGKSLLAHPLFLDYFECSRNDEPKVKQAWTLLLSQPCL